MAKVISWIVGGKYVYIDKNLETGKYIRDVQESEEYIKDLGRKVTRGENGWTESYYSENFSAMRSEVINAFHGAVNIPEDYRLYYNATEEEGVYILTGRDGIDSSNQNKPFYAIQITNNNTCLGLGGNYVLDVPVTLYTHVFLEKDGEIYQPDYVRIDNGSWYVPEIESGYSKVSINIPQGAEFEDNNHVKEYTIYVRKGGWEGKVVFTVVGVKDGEEGVSYDLHVRPRQIKVSVDGVPSNDYVSCDVLINGEKMSTGGAISIVYNFGPMTTDVDDIIGNTYSEPISYEALEESGKEQVNFYLLFNNRLVDSDCCVVVKDGVNAGHVKLELDNEIDGVGVGNDSVLDVQQDVHLQVGFSLYSGSSRIEILSVGVENLGENAEWSSEILGTGNGVLHFYLKNGFEFGEDLRDAVDIHVTGWTTTAGDVYASSVYTIVGVKGGKDGDVYKISPSYDAIVYDPNNSPKHSYGEEYLSAKSYLGTTEITGDASYPITYSIDATYTTKSETSPLTESPADLKIDTLVNTNKYVVFYLWSGSTLLDRETVPILGNGINGNAVWVELTNEIDAISVGEDTRIDLEPGQTITVGTNVVIMSGTTNVPIESVTISYPSSWNQHVTATTAYTAEHLVDHLSVKVDLEINDGFDFGSDYREVATISATADNGWSGSTSYILKGIRGGKDGYAYRLCPSVDYVTYDPNAGRTDIGSNNVTCTAFYGSTEIGHEGFDPHYPDGIYYSINKVCATTADTSSDPSRFITGITICPASGVEVSGLITPQNYKYFKYIAFYLVLYGEIIDRETVKIVSDGLDGQDHVLVQLTNEIDSVGVGTDTILDQQKTLSTEVMMYSGSTRLTIDNITARFSDDSDSSSLNASTGRTGDVFYVTLNPGFDFGEDLKEKLIISVTGYTETGGARSYAYGYSIFVITGIRDGDRGPMTRIRDFSSDYTYQNGSGSDEYLDIVVYHNSNGGGYYLCLTDQPTVPSNPPSVITSGGETIVDPNDHLWRYQPEAAFTASKVATFGTWPYGWVIDSGKIQHTQSAVTLDADGIVKVGGVSDPGAMINGNPSIHAIDDSANMLMIAAGIPVGGDPNDSTFRVYKDGHLYAKNADISGKVQAEKGSIGGLVIDNNSISSSNGNFSLSSDGAMTVSSIKINTENFVVGDNVYNTLNEFISPSSSAVNIVTTLNELIWSGETLTAQESIKGFEDPEFGPVTITSYTISDQQRVTVTISYKVDIKAECNQFSSDSDFMDVSAIADFSFTDGVGGRSSVNETSPGLHLDSANTVVTHSFIGSVSRTVMQSPGGYNISIKNGDYGVFKSNVYSYYPYVLPWGCSFAFYVTGIEIRGVSISQGTEIFKNGFGLKNDTSHYFFTNRSTGGTSSLNLYVATDRNGSNQEKNEISLTSYGFSINSPMFTMGNLSMTSGDYTLKKDDELILYKGNNGTITLPLASDIPVGQHFRIFNWNGNTMKIRVPSGGISAIFKPGINSTSTCGVIIADKTFGQPSDRRSYDVYRIKTVTITEGTDQDGARVISAVCGWVILET